MGGRRRIDIIALGLMLLGLVVSPAPGWGQASERLGTVLAVDGTAEVRSATATTWQALQFRSDIFPLDTVRTAADSKVKILLRDDSVMTLAERSEMQFTEFLLTEQQRRTVVSLALGKLRVVTTKIFGAGSATEVRTANTVAGVRGTTFIVVFIPPDITQVVGIDGVVTVQNPNFPQIEPIPANFRTQVSGDQAPGAATELSPAERQTIELGLRLTEQIPTELQPPVGIEPTQFAALPQLQQTEVQLNQLVARTQAVNTALAPEPPQAGGGLGGGAIIQPDNPVTTGVIQQSQPTLRLTITIPPRR